MGESGRQVELLLALQKEYPSDTPIRKILANVFSSRSLHLASVGGLAELIALTTAARSLHQQYSDDDDLREALVDAMTTWSQYLADKGESAGQPPLIEELRLLRRQFPKKGDHEAWEQLLDFVIQFGIEAGRSVERMSNYVGMFFEILGDKEKELLSEEQLSKEEETAKRAHFMYRVGVGLYERHRYAMAIDVLSGAALVYEGMEGKQRAEGLYRCYGNINYCYTALGDKPREKEFAVKTLEMEERAGIHRVEAVTK